MSATGVGRDEEKSARAAAEGSHDKRAYVRAMFSSIAPRYDLLNHVLSFNIDRGWRRAAIRELEWQRRPQGVYVDVCAGTLDVSVELARQKGFGGRIIGADFAEPMLRAGVAKVDGQPVYAVAADALALPLPDASCTGAISAFGVRNLADLDAGLREIVRVLVPGGRFVILEFTTPDVALIRGLYGFYSNRILPRIGAWISGNRGAYRYLPESVARFPTASALADRMRTAGFSSVTWRTLTFGVAAIHVGSKSTLGTDADQKRFRATNLP